MSDLPIPVSIDLTAALVAYLDPYVGPVGESVPNPRPDKFVKVTVAGTSRDDVVVDESLASIEVWGTDEDETNHRARVVQGLLLNWEGSHDGPTSIYRVSVTGPSWLPDPDVDLPRYQLTAHITHRASLFLTTGTNGDTSQPVVYLGLASEAPIEATP